MDAALPPRPGRRPRYRSTFGAALLGWILPGAGQLYAGRPFKALLFFLATVPVYFLGLWLTDFTAVNPSKYGLEFAAQVLAGGPTAFAAWLCEGRIPETLPRWFDVGRLYVAVGALLNVVAISDAIGEVLDHNRDVADRRRREAVQEQAAREAAAAALPPHAANGTAATDLDGAASAPPPLLPETTWPRSVPLIDLPPEEPR